jgi:hydrogenase nickel incorporation protein HypB
METESAATAPRVICVTKNLLVKNAVAATHNRETFHRRGLYVVNVLSSPGSGKTALLHATLTRLAGVLKAAVVVGDLATDNDARRLHGTGAAVVQLTTGNLCHLEAEMVQKGCAEIDLDGVRLLFIENVGNLVCPASYDLGESLRIVLLAVTEGEDKPLKYPTMFKSADVVIVSKTDLAGPAGFERAQALDNLSQIAPQARVFELSARTGEGMADWCDFLQQKVLVHGDQRDRPA